MAGPLVVASANVHKAAELRDLLSSLGVDLDVVARPEDLAVPDEDAPDFVGNARIKAAAVAAATGSWALADDSGLEVDALDGAPGVHSARFAGDDATDADNVALLLARLTDLAATSPDRRRARFRCCIVVQSPPGPDGTVTELVADGTVEGHIAEAPRGDSGFGYDPVFVPDDRPDGSDEGGDDGADEGADRVPVGRTFAQMSAWEKASISHRGRALRAIAPRLAELS